MAMNAMDPGEGVSLLASGRYATLRGHQDSTDAPISILATLATLSRAPRHTLIPAAPRNIPYVEGSQPGPLLNPIPQKCCGPSSIVCCDASTFCVGISTCCKIGKIGCTDIEGSHSGLPSLCGS
jgi:hypothetical protein